MMRFYKEATTTVTQLISTDNLALLKQSDRFVILAAGLVVVAALGAAQPGGVFQALLTSATCLLSHPNQ